MNTDTTREEIKKQVISFMASPDAIKDKDQLAIICDCLSPSSPTNVLTASWGMEDCIYSTTGQIGWIGGSAINWADGGSDGWYDIDEMIEKCVAQFMPTASPVFGFLPEDDSPLATNWGAHRLWAHAEHLEEFFQIFQEWLRANFEEAGYDPDLETGEYIFVTCEDGSTNWSLANPFGKKPAPPSTPPALRYSRATLWDYDGEGCNDEITVELTADDLTHSDNLLEDVHLSLFGIARLSQAMAEYLTNKHDGRCVPEARASIMEEWFAFLRYSSDERFPFHVAPCEHRGQGFLGIRLD